MVTGASSGIGKAIAVRASELGAIVVLTARDQQRLSESLNELSGEGHTIITADLTNEEQLQQLAGEIPELDGIVHAAGIVFPLPVKFIRHKHLKEVMAINFEAPVVLTSLLIKAGKLNQGISIVVLSSVSSQFPYFGGSLYVASKAALEAWSRNLALELAPQKGRVNALSPGLVRTRILEQTIDASTPEEVAKYESSYPLGFGNPEDVAAAAMFFLSDQSKWITGQNLILDGGLTLGSKK